MPGSPASALTRSAATQADCILASFRLRTTARPPANKVSAHRWLFEKAIGVHRDKLLPEFAASTFERWAKQQGKITGPGAEVVLFQTCYVQHNEPQIGRDTVEVLEHQGVNATCEKLSRTLL